MGADPNAPEFENDDVRAAFEAWPGAIRDRMMALRALIFDTAAATENVGSISESLKWGQPAYRPAANRIGTTVRLGTLRGDPNACAVFVHCQSGLVDTFKRHYPDDFAYEGKRAIILRADDRTDSPELRHCIALALTHHIRKTKT